MKMFKDYIREINQFFRDSGYQVDPVPEVKVDLTEHDEYDPFIDTANYDPGSNRITIFAGNRHLKDILRSYCHELFHHVQDISGERDFSNVRGKLSDNSDLETLEGEAYMNGNVLFRKWTEKSRPS